MTERLIACVLGGTARGAKTELHDVAFAVGDSLEAVHDQLLAGWFGEPRGLHLYFINIGGYRPGVFGEHHAWGFFGAPNKVEAKQRAKDTLLPRHEETHKDDLHEIDDCLQVARIGTWHVHLTSDADAGDPQIANGYFPLPKSVIDTWIARHGSA